MNNRSLKKKFFILAVTLINLLALLANILFTRGGYNRKSDGSAVSESSVCVHYITPGGTVDSDPVNFGTAVSLMSGPEIDGYTFLYWQDQFGNRESRSEITLYEDTWYSAVYAVGLDFSSHTPYLSVDENGFAHPDSAVTRRDVALTVYSFFATPLYGDQSFSDVPEEDSCYDAVCALKTLGVISGSRYFPDSPATLRDVLEIISAFYPTIEGDAGLVHPSDNISDQALLSNACLHGWIDAGNEIDLDDDLSRAEFAVIINALSGRSCDGTSYDLTGYFPDVAVDSPYFYDMAEACVPHEYSMVNGQEVWTSSSPAVASLEPGFMLVGTDLYYVQDNMTVLTSGSVGGFAFDADGHYTSGDSELDALLQSNLREYWEEGISRDELLERLYKHVVNDFSFVSGKRFTLEEVVPSVELAKDFLANGQGNCYYYAAAFCELARALGYDASIYKGNVSGDQSLVNHGWVGIDIDGVTYICDPELELYLKEDIYMLSPEEARRMNYVTLGN